MRMSPPPITSHCRLTPVVISVDDGKSLGCDASGLTVLDNFYLRRRFDALEGS